MTIQIETIGRRHYLLDTPFAAKDRIKDAGCKWDGDKRAWWTGKKDKAESLAAELASADLGLAGFPCRLDDGEWGVRIPGQPTDVVGKSVKVTARGGKSWTAKVTGVARVDDDAVVVRTARDQSESRPRRASFSGTRRCRAHGCTATAANRGYCERCAFDEFDD